MENFLKSHSNPMAFMMLMGSRLNTDLTKQMTSQCVSILNNNVALHNDKDIEIESN